MKGNRILSLHSELKTYQKTKKPAKAKAKANSFGFGLSAQSKNGSMPGIGELVIEEDDVFVAGLLSYFFDTAVQEEQITDALNDVAVKCFWTATQALGTGQQVPPPPKEGPTLLWLVSGDVQTAYRQLRNKGAYNAVKNTVRNKWQSAFHEALNASHPLPLPGTKPQQMAVGNTALVVFIENTGSLPFQWDSRVGKIVQEGLEKVVDYVSEEFEKWLNKFSAAKGRKYREVILLEDQKATYANLKSTLHNLANRGFVIDVFTLTHGNRSSFSAYNGGSISASNIRDIRNSYGSALPIRVVYQMNCQASGLNDDWQYAGARAVAGALNNNYIPEPMMSKFWNNWLRGDSFQVAVSTAYNDSVKLITDTIAKAETFIPLVGGRIKSALESAINPLLADSKPVVAGNGAITVDTAQLAAAQSQAFSDVRYSEAKYGTGEHVLSGIVDASPVTPSHEIDVNGVKFTYGELIAMGDFYENHQQMIRASAAELSKLKTLIDKSKRYYEGNVMHGRPVGSNPSDDDWQGATNNRYLKLAEDNFAHFAPSNSAYITSFTSSKSNHKKEWERYHAQAIGVMRRGESSDVIDEALAINAFGDHFLTDAFAAGHLFNKDDLANYFKSLVLNGSSVNANGEKMFDRIADKAFTGKLASTFSRYETVERKILGIVRPNIDSAAMFRRLLIGIMEMEPDILGKALLAKLVHDKLNNYPGGVPVENNVGDRWNLTGDGTLNKTNLEIMRKAVKQSISNLMDAVGDNSGLPVFYKKVWDIVPRATPGSATIIKNLIRNYANPLGQEIVDGAAQLLQGNYKTLLDELVKRNILKKA